MRAIDLVEGTINSPEFHALLTPAVRKLDHAYRAAGKQVRIVGGAVRDLVRGKQPDDIDMATDATPEESIEILKAAGIRYEPTGLQHGTITAVLDDEAIEITTLRIDAETDGRHASVQFTTDWQVDAERRDLTYNAMSLDLDGNLYDYFGGVEDLKQGVTRFVGDATKRIQEDYLRILRYFRFAGRQATPQWDPETLNAIQANAAGLDRISGERIWAEMFKILGAPTAVNVLEKMIQTGVLEHCGMKVMQNLDKVKQLKANGGGDPRYVLVALTQDLVDLETLRKRWKWDSSSDQLMQYLISNRKNRLNWDDAVRKVAVDGVDPSLVRALLRYQGNGVLADKLKTWSPPKLPITGNDLIKAGFKPGPAIGQAMQNAKHIWFETGFKISPEDLLAQVTNR